jgi:hypothetical protein
VDADLDLDAEADMEWLLRDVVLVEAVIIMFPDVFLQRG